MSVIGADLVERAHRDQADLTVAKGDLLTPLALERARELRVQIVRDGAPRSTAVEPATALPPTTPTAATRRETTNPAAGFDAHVRLGIAGAPRSVTPGTANSLYRRGAPLGN